MFDDQYIAIAGRDISTTQRDAGGMDAAGNALTSRAAAESAAAEHHS